MALAVCIFSLVPYIYPPQFDDIINKRIRKYYTQEQINEEDIRVIGTTRTEIRLSNGVVLHQAEHNSYINELDIFYYFPLFLLFVLIYRWCTKYI